MAFVAVIVNCSLSCVQIWNLRGVEVSAVSWEGSQIALSPLRKFIFYDPLFGLLALLCQLVIPDQAFLLLNCHSSQKKIIFLFWNIKNYVLE